MRELNTRITEGNYSITFETDDRKAFEQVQTLCRMLIDGEYNEASPFAIPIVFIKRLIAKFDCERGNSIKDTYAHILTALIEFWEYEQETEKWNWKQQ